MMPTNKDPMHEISIYILLLFFCSNEVLQYHQRYHYHCTIGNALIAIIYLFSILTLLYLLEKLIMYIYILLIEKKHWPIETERQKTVILTCLIPEKLLMWW